MAIPAAIRTFPKYLRHFGAARGIRVWAKTQLAKVLPRSRRIRIDLAAWGGPLYLRAGTSDVNVFHQVFVEREHDIPIRFEPRVVVDAGANAGYSTLFFAHRFPSAHVIAIEPDAENFEMLQLHVGGLPNVRAVRAALWSDKVSGLAVRTDTAHFARTVAPIEGSAMEGVAALTIPDILDMVHATSIDLLKVDIEGSEIQVFGPASRNWIGAVRVLLIECHDRMVPGCSAAVRSAVASALPNRIGHGEFDVFFARPEDLNELTPHG